MDLPLYQMWFRQLEQLRPGECVTRLRTMA